jgi:hypothetical protein
MFARAAAWESPAERRDGRRTLRPKDDDADHTARDERDAGIPPWRERMQGQPFAALAAVARRCSREPDASPLDATVMRMTPTPEAARCDPVFARCRDRDGKRWNAPRGRDVREPYEGAQCRDELEASRPRNEK